jgi:hypothetical protein
VDGIQFTTADGKEIKANWKMVKPNQVEVTLPLKNAQPGAMTLVVNQAGLKKAESVAVHTYAEAGHLESFTVHAGDHQGMLTGTRLDEVASLQMKGIEFRPGTLSSVQGTDDLPMEALNVKSASALKAGESLKAVATLRDGRVVNVMAAIDAARPSVALIEKSVEPANTAGNGAAGNGQVGNAASSNIQLSDQNELPQNATLLFSLKAQTPERFSREEKIEVATNDGSYSTTLTLANGLTLQDAHTALATLDPAKAFGASAFGPLQFRVVTDNGVKGDWQPLATLVRLPRFQSLQCGDDAAAECKLRGSDLFLVAAIAQNQQFVNPMQVPDGFPGRVLPVPHPQDGGELYVKLRDDPSVVNVVTLTPEIADSGKKAAKQEAAKEQVRPDYVSPDRSAAPAGGAPGSSGKAAAPASSAPASSGGSQTQPAVPSTAAPATAAPSSAVPATAPPPPNSGSANQNSDSSSSPK